MIPIVIYTASAAATGSIVRRVTCEDCRKDYVFNVDATVESQATSIFGVNLEHSQKKAEQEAVRLAKQEAHETIRIVPCPSCGWYQKHMVDELRSRIPGPWGTESLGLFGIGGLMMFVGSLAAAQLSTTPKWQHEEYALETWTGVAVVGLILALIGGFIVVRNSIRRAEVSPNEKVPLNVRLERGRTKAMNYEEFARLHPDADVVRFRG